MLMKKIEDGICLEPIQQQKHFSKNIQTTKRNSIYNGLDCGHEHYNYLTFKVGLHIDNDPQVIKKRQEKNPNREKYNFGDKMTESEPFPHQIQDIVPIIRLIGMRTT